MLDFLQKKLTSTFVKPYLTWYLRREHTSRINGFGLLVKPGIFHPKYFFSSNYLFDFVNRQELNEKIFLEIGCGSGLISLLAYKKKANVTCTDINPTAIECTRLNFEKNYGSDFSRFACIKSDLFKKIRLKKYDVIVINPPYFFKDAANELQLAWNCGKNGEYFKKLFSGIKNYMHNDTEVFMILADNCDIERIKGMAHEDHLSFTLVEKKKIKWETNFIFKIT